jgi:hypothetical protein
MTMKLFRVLVWVMLSTLVVVPAAWSENIITYPLNDLKLVRSQTGVVFDQDVSSDGKGSLRVEANKPMVVELLQTGDLDVENTRLFYQAKLKSKGLQGRAYLEMWCVFENKGRYFSRGLNAPVSGNTEWVGRETFFVLQPGQNPVNVELNLVIEGKGTVWIDHIRLLKLPLP